MILCKNNAYYMSIVSDDIKLLIVLKNRELCYITDRKSK